MTPDLTAEAVREVLTEAGFPAAEMDDRHDPVTPGFNAYLLPMPAGQERMSVDWHFPYGERTGDAVHDPYASPLAACAVALADAGYRTEFVTDFPCGYLVVWTRGEF